MPTESLRNSESNGKRKVKNKIPKRLRRKNKQNDINTEENITNNIPTTGNTINCINQIWKARILSLFRSYIINKTENG